MNPAHSESLQEKAIFTNERTVWDGTTRPVLYGLTTTRKGYSLVTRHQGIPRINEKKYSSFVRKYGLLLQACGVSGVHLVSGVFRTAKV